MGVKPEYVYVASSWKNPLQTAIVAALRSAEIPCYDFKHDKGAGFHWSDVGITDPCTFKEYIVGISRERADEGFASDLTAMLRADTFILVLPCGRSSHLELGWAVGQGKRTAIYFDDCDEVTPELMYKMVDFRTESLFDLLGWLGVED